MNWNQLTSDQQNLLIQANQAALDGNTNLAQALIQLVKNSLNLP